MQVIYNVVLASCVQQSDSDIYVYVFIFFPTLGDGRTWTLVPHAVSRALLFIYFIHSSLYVPEGTDGAEPLFIFIGLWGKLSQTAFPSFPHLFKFELSDLNVHQQMNG